MTEKEEKKHISEKLCYICSKNLEEPLYLYSVCLPCGGVFHSQCIKNYWIPLCEVCPHCKSDLEIYRTKLKSDLLMLTTDFLGEKPGRFVRCKEPQIVFDWFIANGHLGGKYPFISALLNGGAFEWLNHEFFYMVLWVKCQQDKRKNILSRRGNEPLRRGFHPSVTFYDDSQIYDELHTKMVIAAAMLHIKSPYS